MKVPDVALVAVAKNSIRHANEADDHFKNQRFASGLSSAVLSIEETGKLFFLASTGKNITKHPIKQLPYALLLTLAEQAQWIFYWQNILKEGLELEAVLSDEQASFVSKNPEFADLVAELRAGKLTEVQERVTAFGAATEAMYKRDGTMERLRPWTEGALHKMRLQATYVDVNAAGDVTSDPSSIKSEFVEKLCGVAALLLILAITIFVPKKEAQQLAGSLHPDMTGSAILVLANDFVKIFAEAKRLKRERTVA
jgi:hypothetical protein